jgi:hypothetical protein
MRKIPLCLLLGCLALLLNACSGAGQCVSGKEETSDNFITGERGGDATIATLCTDKQQYNQGDKVHITLTVRNGLDKQIVLDGGQQPVMDICIASWPDQCLSQIQPTEARLTHLVLEHGQSHTIQWDWLPSAQEIQKLATVMNTGQAYTHWIGVGGASRDLRLNFTYGPKMRGP